MSADSQKNKLFFFTIIARYVLKNCFLLLILTLKIFIFKVTSLHHMTRLRFIPETAFIPDFR